MSSEIDERTFREVHLVAFEAAVVEAGTWSVMSSYNRLNGTYASDHRWLLTELLRDEWGFDGAVISDWGGTMSIGPAVSAGCDLEMPGPGTRARHLADAVTAGEVSEADVDLAASRVARLARRAAEAAGDLGDGPDPGRRRLSGRGGRRGAAQERGRRPAARPRTPPIGRGDRPVRRSRPDHGRAAARR